LIAAAGLEEDHDTYDEKFVALSFGIPMRFFKKAQESFNRICRALLTLTFCFFSLPVPLPPPLSLSLCGRLHMCFYV